MYRTYILYSASSDKFYVGHTANLTDRVFRHNNSGSKSTKHCSDWELKYSKAFATRAEAMAFEKEIKAQKSKIFIKELISSAR